MDQGRKPGRSKSGTGPPSSSAPSKVRPTSVKAREVRVNWAAFVLVATLGLLVVPGILGVKYLQDRAGRSALLAEARKQRDSSKRPDLALGYLNRYLELAPDDLDALDQRARLLGEVAREPGAVNSAIQAHVQLLARKDGGPAAVAARKRLAELYLRSHQHRAAEQVARESLKQDGNDAEGHRLLARALEGAGRLGDAKALADAVSEYEAAEALQPGDVGSAERLAFLYFDKFSDKPKALRVLEALRDRNPSSVAARLARSRFFAEAGDLVAASTEIDAALKLDPSDVDARLAAAEASARRGDPTSARSHLASIRPSRPDDVRVKLIQGVIELDERKGDEAIKNWREGLILSGGSDADLTWRLAHILIQLGRVREAEPLLSQFRRLSGGEEPTPSYRYLVGLACLKSGRSAEGIAELEAIRYKIDRGLEGQLQLALGQAYESSLEPAKALDAYTKASMATNVGVTPWLSIARLQSSTSPNEAVATLERAVATVKSDPTLLGELAKAQWRKQAGLPKEKRDWRDLEQVLEQGKKVAPDSVDLALVRAEYAVSLDRPGEGTVILGEALKRSPTSVPLWLSEADALARLGDLDSAVRRLTEAVEAAGEQAAFRIAQARYSLKKGEVKAARASLVDGLDRVPLDQKPALLKTLGEFHQTQGDRAAARQAFLDWSAIQPDAVDPHLTLLNLAIDAGDERGVDAEVEALKAIGGPKSLYWKIAKAEQLLQARTGSTIAPDRLREAGELVEEIKAAAPRQSAGYLLEARLMEQRNLAEPAILAYEKALELKAGNLALRPMVALLARLGRFDDLDSLRSRVGGFPADVERMAGAMVLRQGAPEKAEELARRMVAGDPAGLDARAWQAKVLGRLGKTDEAEASLRQLVNLRPDFSAPWIQLLMFQVSRGDQARASGTIEQMKGQVKVDRPELLWALCYRVANLRPQADRAFADALRVHPDEVGTLQSAVDYYEATGRPERAEPLLRRALKGNPGLDWVRRRLSLNLAGRPGNVDAWRESLQLAGEEPDASDTPDDRLTRAVVLSLGPEPRRREAVTILERLAVEMPESARVQESLARALLGVGDSAKAREHASRAASKPDASADAIRLAVALDLAANDPEAAGRNLTRLDGTSGADDPGTLELRARVLKAQGNPKEAVERIERAFAQVERSPGALDFGRALIRLLSSIDEPEAAEAMARRVAKLAPAGRIALAEFLGSRGDFDEAAAVFEAASRERSSSRDAARSALSLASMTREPRWIELSDRLIDRATEVEPDDAELAYARASLRHLQGRLEEAVKLYDELAARSPANLLFMNNCAWILSEELGRPLEGLKRIESLIGKDGGQPHTLDTRGVIFLRLGRFAEAVRDLETAVGSIPTPTIRYHLGRAYLAAGRNADATASFDRARAGGLKAEQLQPSERAEMNQLIDMPR